MSKSIAFMILHICFRRSCAHHIKTLLIAMHEIVLSIFQFASMELMTLLLLGQCCQWFFTFLGCDRLGLRFLGKIGYSFLFELLLVMKGGSGLLWGWVIHGAAATNGEEIGSVVGLLLSGWKEEEGDMQLWVSVEVSVGLMVWRRREPRLVRLAWLVRAGGSRMTGSVLVEREDLEGV